MDGGIMMGVAAAKRMSSNPPAIEVGKARSSVPRLLMLELNELCPRLLRQFMDEGILPNFRRIYDTSYVFTTDAEESPPNLEPWIQWVSVHSGLGYGQHGISNLGDGKQQEHKEVAELLSDAGVSVGVFGSMNTNYKALSGYLIPDPWDRDGVAQPAWLAAYYYTVSRQVQNSAQDGTRRKGLLRFGWFMVRNGLRVATVWAVLRQLGAERREPDLRWRRAMVLERLQYDLFRRLNRRFDVRFATLFCNSTAHFQHYYWRQMQPELFDIPPEPDDHPSLRHAIADGYRSMDLMLGQVLEDYPDAVLVLCTALSQQPWTSSTKCTYRPLSFETLLEFAGISATVKPVMAEQFHLDFEAENEARAAVAKLEDLQVDGELLMDVERHGSSLFAGCHITRPDCADLMIKRGRDGATHHFSDLFAMVHAIRSGRHHPDGVLWVRQGRHRVFEDKVALTDIAPTILAHFGLAKPEHMKGRRLPLS